jgi:polyribonucleotide nucleotidyltransferase
MATSLSLSNIGKNPLVFSTGDWAKQAGGAVSASLGDTVLLATVCMSQTAKDEGFLPLIVEYQEKTYAMGKIPGGYIKREGRPKDKEILCARLIDRPLRPLFPQGLTNEIQIVVMVLSSDAKNDPDVLAINAASCALLISDIPFDNPVGAVRVVKVDNDFIVNPTYEERGKSSLELVVVGTRDKIVMLEGCCKEVSEEDTLAAIKIAQPLIKEIVDIQEKLRQNIGKKKREVTLSVPNKDIYNLIKDKVYAKLEGIYGLVGKEERESAVAGALKSISEEILKEDSPFTAEDIEQVFFALEEEFFRHKIINEDKRPDSRSLKDIRAIDCKVRVLPRTHGSAVFTRGQTQSLAITTLGTTSDAQTIEALDGVKSVHFMLHYAFPPFSTGEIKMMRGPSRRDIGHGALAEKALVNMIPSKDVFPYTIRVVSEILESNGSSSMATVCATTLSLMDAGVPIKEPVAGIALGLVSDGDKYKILTDIAGVEDHCGDMDFKVAGTKNGITAIQLDIKINGLTFKIIEDGLQRAKEARMYILEKMKEALSLPRETISQYAPKIRSIKIDIERIGSVIGPGGKFIRKILRDYNVNIDIDDETGMVSIVAEDEASLEKAAAQVTALARDIEPGDIYDAKVVKLMNFGAFCEIVPGKQGLVHVSEIADTYVKDVTQYLKEGDIVKVKVTGIDAQGKISLSIKQAR